MHNLFRSSSNRGILEIIGEEAEEALLANGPFHSSHEAYAVLLEEVDELWEEIRKKKQDRDWLKMYNEAVHIAAVAARFAEQVYQEGKCP